VAFAGLRPCRIVGFSGQVACAQASSSPRIGSFPATLVRWRSYSTHYRRRYRTTRIVGFLPSDADYRGYGRELISTEACLRRLRSSFSVTWSPLSARMCIVVDRIVPDLGNHAFWRTLLSIRTLRHRLGRRRGTSNRRSASGCLVEIFGYTRFQAVNAILAILGFLSLRMAVLNLPFTCAPG